VCRDQDNNIRNNIVAIDAVVAHGMADFIRASIKQDINKVYIGLSNPKITEGEYSKSPSSRPVFVTGNWGCGAFGGDLQLKAIEQLLGASEAGFDLIYSTYKQNEFKLQLDTFWQWLVKNKVTVGMLYKTVLQLRPQKNNAFQQINELLSHDYQLEM